MYVFDTSAFIHLFSYYYRARFPSLWQLFDHMVDEGNILSVEETFQEIGEQDAALHQWAKMNRHLFSKPTATEAQIVRDIFANPHFRQLIDKKKILKGGYIADPWIIAKAKAMGGSVVTMEKYKENAAKIPNICKKFKVPCYTLEDFMAQENWTF